MANAKPSPKASSSKGSDGSLTKTANSPPADWNSYIGSASNKKVVASDPSLYILLNI